MRRMGLFSKLFSNKGRTRQEASVEGDGTLLDLSPGQGEDIGPNPEVLSLDPSGESPAGMVNLDDLEGDSIEPIVEVGGHDDSLKHPEAGDLPELEASHGFGVSAELEEASGREPEELREKLLALEPVSEPQERPPLEPASELERFSESSKAQDFSEFLDAYPQKPKYGEEAAISGEFQDRPGIGSGLDLQDLSEGDQTAGALAADALATDNLTPDNLTSANLAPVTLAPDAQAQANSQARSQEASDIPPSSQKIGDLSASDNLDLSPDSVESRNWAEARDLLGLDDEESPSKSFASSETLESLQSGESLQSEEEGALSPGAAADSQGEIFQGEISDKIQTPGDYAVDSAQAPADQALGHFGEPAGEKGSRDDAVSKYGTLDGASSGDSAKAAAPEASDEDGQGLEEPAEEEVLDE